MASTITNLINTIDTEFPVAGQDNDSQGFRNNFNIIQQSLLATQGEIDGINNTISTLGGAVYTTATHIVALQDVTIGTTATVKLSVNENNDIVAKSTSSSMVLIGLAYPVTTQAAYALTDSPTDSTATTFAVTDSRDVEVGATVTIGGSQRTVTAVDKTTNYITVNPAFTVPAFAVGDSLTFNNPYNIPTGTLFLDGDIEVTGNITAYAGSPSDNRLKENVSTINDALNKVIQLRGVNYDWTNEYLSTLKFPDSMPKQDTGVIAQEVKEVFPEIVFTKPDGYLGVKYEKFAGVLIEAIKELNQKVIELEAKIDSLTSKNV